MDIRVNELASESVKRVQGWHPCPANKKREPKLSLSDQTDKPGSVVCGNLSTLTVAGKLEPSLLHIRRADVMI